MGRSLLDNLAISNNPKALDGILTPKQQVFFFSDDKRLNFLSGSVRSGKTYVSLLKFAIEVVGNSPPGSQFLMCGNTLSTLKRNCLSVLLDLVGQNNFWYSINRKEGILFGRKVYLEGASDETSEHKIRGMTLSGAYCDEITLFPQSFVSMLLTRLSTPNAKLYATCNPDSPNHYIKTEYIDAKGLDCATWTFALRDNTFLTEEFLESMEKEFKGVFYRRFILGEWCKAEGLVYPMYENTVPTKDRPYTQYVVSMDYGIMNPTAMLLWGLCDNVWYLVKEYYYSGRETNVQKTDEQYYTELEKLAGDLPVSEVIIDPSAASFIALCRQKGRFFVRKAANAVLEGIQNTALCIARKDVLVNDCCKNTIREFSLYSWDEKKEKDEVIKENDHAMDAFRYFVQTKRIYRKQGDYKSIFG